MNNYEEKIQLGLIMADDFFTSVNKHGSQVRYSIPIYVGNNLDFFEDIQSKIEELVKEKKLGFLYNKFFMIIIKNKINLSSNVSFFPANDLIDDLTQQDADLLAFESDATDLQIKIAEILQEKIEQIKNKHSKLRVI